jgi:8-oxo-dGTP diphosphatase
VESMSTDRRPWVGVGCVPVRDGEVLLIHRRGAHGGGTWSTPGGHLDPGESVEACAARETFEEVGLSVSNVRFGAITNDVFEQRHYVTIWMVADVLTGDARVADAEEVIDVGWFGWDELPSPLFLSFENLVARRNIVGLDADALGWTSR